MKYREVKEILEKYSSSDNLLIIGRKVGSTSKTRNLKDKASSIPEKEEMHNNHYNTNNDGDSTK